MAMEMTYYDQAARTLDRAKKVHAMVESPVVKAAEQASIVMTLAADGYISGRWDNPAPLGAPFELWAAGTAYLLALGNMYLGGEPVADRVLMNTGASLLGAKAFKYFAALGLSHRPAAAPAASSKGSVTGLATPRRDIIDGAVPRHTITGDTGALSAQEAARLAHRH